MRIKLLQYLVKFLVLSIEMNEILIMNGTNKLLSIDLVREVEKNAW